MDSSPDESSISSGGLAGVQSLVASLYGLQGGRSRLRGELHLMHSQLEDKEQDRNSRILAFQQQVGDMLSISSLGECCMQCSTIVLYKFYFFFLPFLFIILYKLWDLFPSSILHVETPFKF